MATSIFFKFITFLFVINLLIQFPPPGIFNFHLLQTINETNIFFSQADSTKDSLKIDIKIPTFLGNEKRNFYGNSLPTKLEVIWKINLGKGETVISRKIGTQIWAGAGWTGQPLLVMENNVPYLIQGAYDHNLKKINAQTCEIVWQYQFDDVVKGTGTIWENKNCENFEDKYVILQGSRLGLGNYLDSKHIPSYRAISYITGKELWRLDVKWTDSYSRDVDGSALVINDTAYLGLENSLFTVFDPDYRYATVKDNMLQPRIFQELKLYEKEDVIFHKNNIVTESSPCLLNSMIYITSGSGHVYGYNRNTKKLEWDFYIGSDMDGSPVVTSDSCLLVSVEKQYIKGKGGAFKLDPSKSPEKSVVWFFPTENKEFSGWEGGIIGSIGVNDYYNKGNFPYLAAFSAIDGYLYIADHKSIKEGQKVLGPDNYSTYNTPEILFKKNIGPSISTPIIINDKLVAAGYNGIHLFEFDKNMNFQLLDKVMGSFEATPVAFNNKIYIASREGFLFCFGEKN